MGNGFGEQGRKMAGWEGKGQRGRNPSPDEKVAHAQPDPDPGAFSELNLFWRLRDTLFSKLEKFSPNSIPVRFFRSFPFRFRNLVGTVVFHRKPFYSKSPQNYGEINCR